MLVFPALSDGLWAPPSLLSDGERGVELSLTHSVTSASEIRAPVLPHRLLSLLRATPLVLKTLSASRRSAQLEGP
jgi:hypothetical protein